MEEKRKKRKRRRKKSKRRTEKEERKKEEERRKQREKSRERRRKGKRRRERSRKEEKRPRHWARVINTSVKGRATGGAISCLILRPPKTIRRNVWYSYLTKVKRNQGRQGTRHGIIFLIIV